MHTGLGLDLPWTQDWKMDLKLGESTTVLLLVDVAG